MEQHLIEDAVWQRMLAALETVPYMAWFRAGLHVKVDEAGLTLPGRMVAP